MASYEQLREGYQHVDLAAGFEHTAQAALLKAELPLDHSEWVLTFRTDVRIGGFDQITQPSLRGVG